MNGSTELSATEMVVPKKRSGLADFFIRLVKQKPLGTFGAIIVLVMLFCGIFADVIAPTGLNEPNPDFRLAPPELGRPFGSDNLGRDLFSRVIYGARISVIVGLSAASLTLFISTSLGMLSGFLGGKFDLILQRFVDAWMCFPGLVLLIVLISLVGHGMWQVIIVMGLSWGISNSRVSRGLIISMKENVYIQAATAVGCPTWRIILRHLMPNIAPLLIVGFSILVPELILAEASLSFLGMGVPPPAPSWGGMLSKGALNYMYDAPWMAIWPGAALAVTVYGTNMFGDALRDLLDPRLKGGAGRYGTAKTAKKVKGPDSGSEKA